MHPNKNPTLEAFLAEVIGIADKEYQKRVWIRGEGPEIDDFDETVCRYSNAADLLFERHKNCDISAIQMHLIRKLHQQFEKFWKNNDFPQQFIDTPEWTHITELAKEVLRAFNYDPDEHAKE